MTNQAAIDILNAFRVGCGGTAINQALNMAIAAMEAREALAPILTFDGYADGNPVYDSWQCPGCGTEYELHQEDVRDFCPKCGQALKWEWEES